MKVNKKAVSRPGFQKTSKYHLFDKSINLILYEIEKKESSAGKNNKNNPTKEDVFSGANNYSSLENSVKISRNYKDSPGCSLNKHLSPSHGKKTSICKKGTSLPDRQKTQECNPNNGSTIVSVGNNSVAEMGINLPDRQKTQECNPNNGSIIISVGRNSAAENKFFCDVQDCMPETFHRHLSFITTKAQKFYCKLCKCSIGDVQNLFSSAIILHDHFSSICHKNQFDLVTITESSKSNLINELKDLKEAEFKDVSSKINKHQNQNQLDNLKSYTLEKRIDVSEQIICNTTKVQSCSIAKSILVGLPNTKNKTESNINAFNSSKLVSLSKLSDNFENVTKIKLTIPSLSSVEDHIRKFPERLKAHEKFLKLNDGIFLCSLCSVDINANETDVTKHIAEITHKLKFLSQLKKYLEENQRPQMKFLMFVNGQLYCSLCKCYITTCCSFEHFCQEVKVHFEREVHSSNKGKFIASVKKEETDPKRKEEGIIKSSIFVGQSLPKLAGACKDKKKPFPLSKKILENTKIDVSLKRLISIAPLVRANKDFIQKVDCNFYCSLCSEYLSYSPQKYILSKNFNAHFKSRTHMANLLKTKLKRKTKMEKDDASLQTYKEKCQKLYKLSENDLLKRTKSKTCFKTIQKFNPIKVNRSNFKGTRGTFVGFRIVNRNGRKVGYYSKKEARLKLIKKQHYPILDIKQLDKVQNKSVECQKMHPLLQKLVCKSPLLLINKQYITRPEINFYCTLCQKHIPYSQKKYILAKNFNEHFQSTAHVSLVENHNYSEIEGTIPSSVKNSKCRSKSILLHHTCVAMGCKVPTKVFRKTFDWMSKSKNEELFFCNSCHKFIRTVPFVSFESSIIQHCKKLHCTNVNLLNEVWLNDIISCNDTLKANFEFIELSCHNAACTLCCKLISFAENCNVLINNLLLHFKSARHQLFYKSKRQNKCLNKKDFFCGKSKKYNLKPFIADDLI